MKRARPVRAALVPVLLLVTSASLCCAGETTDTSDSRSESSVLASPDRTAELPDPATDGAVSLEQAVKARRSVREYTDEPLTLSEIGQLLWAAQGITSDEGARAAPSAGGTYPLEIYVAAGRVAGLEPGVYRYRPATHDLILSTTGDARARLADASLDQVWVREGAAVVVIGAVYSRTTERYGERGVRYVHLEAGHAAQNLCLQATALGLAAVTVGAFSDDEVQDVLHMAREEEPLYVLPIGRPSSP
ncbi:MAG: SagB/ThcOx family dehydrogenase [bacterium]